MAIAVSWLGLEGVSSIRDWAAKRGKQAAPVTMAHRAAAPLFEPDNVHEYRRTHQEDRRRQSDRAFHEGHAAVSDVRVLLAYGAGAEILRRAVRLGQRT